MTIPDEVLGEAAIVAPKAQEMRGFTNPFVSLQSLESLCQGNETLEVCLRDVVVYSLRYAETVCRFEQIVLRGQQSNEDDTRKEIEHVRSSIHDATISNINILARSLRKEGKDNQWVSKLVQGGRAAYGKFSLLLAFEIALQERCS